MFIRTVPAHRLASGGVVWTLGVPLLGETRDGRFVALNADTAGEVTRNAPRSYVLSTESAMATDGHVVRQKWDLSRSTGANSPGIHAFFGHSYGIRDHVGEWENLGVRDIGGPSLVGDFRADESSSAEVIGKIDRGFLRSVSVGWIPGERVRRSLLAEGDPLRKAAEEDECGSPMEGYVLGSDAQPNHLMECSFTFIPADPRATSLDGREIDALGSLAAGDRVPVRSVGLAGMLAGLRDAPGVRTFLRAVIREELGSANSSDVRAVVLEELARHGLLPFTDTFKV